MLREGNNSPRAGGPRAVLQKEGSKNNHRNITIKGRVRSFIWKTPRNKNVRKILRKSYTKMSELLSIERKSQMLEQ